MSSSSQIDQIGLNQRTQVNRLAPFRDHIHFQIREQCINRGVWHPANRWRQSFPNLQKPKDLAKKLPFLTKFNFARR